MFETVQRNEAHTLRTHKWRRRGCQRQTKETEESRDLWLVSERRSHSVAFFKEAAVGGGGGSGVSGERSALQRQGS